jgi:hypothetical protein
MISRDLLINEDLSIAMHNTLDKQESWNVHIDEFLLSRNSIKVNGWAFNSNEVEIKSICLSINNIVTDPISFNILDRTDVKAVHPKALSSCGFGINFQFDDDIIEGEIALLFFSHLSSVGYYFPIFFLANDCK